MPTDTLTRPRLDRSKVIQQIAELADEQRFLHKTYALPHGSKEFEAAMQARYPLTIGRYVCWPQRDCNAVELTALHIALAESRGKVHCDVDAWSTRPDGWSFAAQIVEARKLITEIPALDVK